MTGRAPEQPVPSGEVRLGPFGAALVSLMVASAYMQYTLGVLGPVLVDRFDISRTQLGLLTSILFLVGSTGSPLAGRWIDRLGARRLLPFPFLATITAFVILSVAPSYAVVVLAVGVAGTGMAFANPLSNKLVGLHVSRGRQGLLMGIKQSGVQLGAAIAGLIMPWAVVAGGLLGAGLGTAGVIALGLIWTLTVVPDDAGVASAPRVDTTVEAGNEASDRTHDEPTATPDDLPTAASRRALLLWIGTYALLMGSGIASVYAYLPLFAVDELGMSVGRAGVLAGLIGMIGIVSRVVWGAVSERLRHPALALFLLAATAVLAQSMVWASPVLGTWSVWAAVVVLGGSAVAWNAVAMFAVIRVLGTRTAGANSGVVQLAFFSGFAIGPLAFGVITDLTGSYSAGWAAITACFATASIVSGRWASLARNPGTQASS